MERIAPGEFCWVELATSDRAAALAFYAGLFGWSTVEQQMGPAGRRFTYSILSLGDRYVGSMYELLAEQRERGVAPHWLPFVAVESVDRIVRRAEELGAACLVDPVELLQAGRVAILEDPTGASFAVWEARHLLGFQVRDEPGSPCSFELATADGKGAVEFYGALFGWANKGPAKSARETVVLAKGDLPVAGVTALPAGRDLAPCWTTHFAVTDRDASCRKIESAGGKVASAPAQAPGDPRSAAVADPHGASFSIVERRG